MPIRGRLLGRSYASRSVNDGSYAIRGGVPFLTCALRNLTGITRENPAFNYDIVPTNTVALIGSGQKNAEVVTGLPVLASDETRSGRSLPFLSPCRSTLRRDDWARRK